MADTFSTECPPRQPLVDGLFDRGDIVTFAAPPGTGKSPLIAQLGLCVGAGKPFLGLPTHKSRVALIDLESKPGRHRELLQVQLQALGTVLGAVDMDVFVCGNEADANSRELDRLLAQAKPGLERFLWLEALVEKQQYGLIAIDTALTFQPIKSGDEERIRLLFKWVRNICRTPPYPAIVLVLHLRKRDRKAPCPSLLDDPN